MPRPRPTDVPPCPDHKSGVITRRGYSGAHRRRMYRCRLANGNVHYFTDVLPNVLRNFHYPIEIIAHSLVLLGRGTSYYGTAVEARDLAGRKESRDTNLAAFWLDRFAPAILEELLPKPRQSPIMLLDTVPFHVTDYDDEGFPIKGGRMRFAVFGAASQQHKGEPPLLLRLHASWHKDLVSWRSFLKTVPGSADLIVCDGEAAINQTARMRWPRAKLSICEWHLRHRAEEILTTAKRNSQDDPLFQALRVCLHSSREWERFAKLARASKLPKLMRWMRDVQVIVSGQLRRREHPRSTGALETKLAQVNRTLELQRGSYDALPRLNLVLGLMTLNVNHLDRERQYVEIIRRRFT